MFNLILVFLSALGIAGFRIGAKTESEDGRVHLLKQIAVAAFYILYLAATKYLAGKMTYLLRNDYKEGENNLIWIYCLVGAVIWFSGLVKHQKENRNIFTRIFEEIMYHGVFVATTVLAFCTQELERLHISTVGTGVMVVAVYGVVTLIGYRYSDKERFLNMRDVFLLYLITCVMWYLGTALFNPGAEDMFGYIPISVLVTFVPVMLILFVTASFNMTIILSVAINLIWTLSHYFVYQFRGTVLLPVDILVAKTAMTVADQYEYELNTEMWKLCMFSVVMVMLSLNIRRIGVKNKKLMFRIIGTGITCVSILLWYNSDFVSYMHLPNDPKMSNNSLYNKVGYTMGFIESMKNSKVLPPDNYSREYVAKLASRYSSVTDEAAEIKPDIIVIMNETFADVGDLGEINTNIDYMPYYHSLETSQATAVGRTLISTIGGGTCNSEYEFLTGNSQEFRPAGYPYQTEIHSNIYSLVSTLKAQGYYGIVTHPNTGTFWNRQNVYKFMQFDEIYFIDDYDKPEYIHGYVSDKEVYKNILSWMDNRGNNDPCFCFAVTIQNHGGYKLGYIREGEELEIRQNSTGEPSQLDEYLSLVYESDKALEELIKTVDERKEPTVVVMFGDHFPGLLEETWNAIISGDKDADEVSRIKYSTPYVVHANYDVDMSDMPEYLSVNYLASNILKSCGLKMTAYNRYLLDMEKEIPAFNHLTFMTASGAWYRYADGYPKKYQEMFNEYNILQYNLRYKDAMQQMFAVQ